MKPTKKESFEDFRESFFYGSRSDLNFKFLKHFSDEEASAFLALVLREVVHATDSDELKSLKQIVLTGQAAAHAHPEKYTYENGPFHPFPGKVKEAKLTLITSSGHFMKGNDPRPFGEANLHQTDAEKYIKKFLKLKPAFSQIPFAAKFDQLEVRHGGYDTSPTRKDPNITFPWQRIRELHIKGFIGALSDYAYSFVGACSQERLLGESLPVWIDEMKANHVDGAILIPV